MKKLVFLLAAAIVILIGYNNTQINAGTNAKEQTADPIVCVSFSYEKQEGYASNQIAIWVEDANGKYVNALYATQWTVKGGYTKRPNSLPVFVERSSLASMNAKQVDAFAGATPSTGKHIYTWNLKDAKGERVANGSYKILLEATLRDQKMVIYTTEVNIDGAALQVHPTAAYKGEESKERNMVKDVLVKYIR